MKNKHKLKITVSGGFRKRMPSPTTEELKDPIFEAIWNTTKTWDVNVPEYYDGYCGMNGSHAVLILRAIRKLDINALYHSIIKEK